MNSLPDIASGQVPARFDPKTAKIKDERYDAVIRYAKRVKDWEKVEEAVDQKLDDQVEFVGWWRENVRGKGERANVADRGHFVEDAEKLSGITKQQVSKWSKRLAWP